MKKLITLLSIVAFSLSAQVVDYKAINFQWDPALENERVTSYRLWYKEAGVESYSDYIVVLGDVNTGSVLNLDSNKTYSAVVTAINTVEGVDLESEPSNEVEFTTQEFYETPSSPENLGVTSFVHININL